MRRWLDSGAANTRRRGRTAARHRDVRARTQTHLSTIPKNVKKSGFLRMRGICDNLNSQSYTGMVWEHVRVTAQRSAALEE